MGLVVFAAFVGTVSAYMIERLQKESRGMGKGDLYENHVILCGLGTVGYRIVQTLKRMDEKVVVIDNDEESEFHELARDSKAQVIVDDVKRKGALKEAGIARAKAVIACTSDDLTNLEIALDARSERPDVRVVLRMFDQRLAEKIAEGFNIQVALSVSALSAPAFAAAAIDRSVKGSLEVGDILYIHSEFVVPPTSALTEMTVDDLKTRFGVHTLAIWNEEGRGSSEPGVDEAIPGGATVSVVGPYDRIAELKEAFGVTQDLVKAASRPSSLLSDD
jgi:Trk K+ transport system NAD-binding subunit